MILACCLCFGNIINEKTFLIFRGVLALTQRFKVRNDDVIKVQDNQGFVAPVVSWLCHIKFIWKWDTFRMTVFRLSRVNVLHGQKFTCSSNTNYSTDLFSFSFSLNKQRFRTRKSKCGSTFTNIGKRRLIKINNKFFWNFF